jgi:nicotinamidase-related amidase
MNRRVELLLIDPQNDFCDKNGSLFVPGADEDSLRLATMIERIKNKIYNIHVTLDTHHYLDIAHPMFWTNSEGSHPQPFTLISKQDIADGTWRTTNPAEQDYGKQYIETLEANNRYLLCIWPPHCLIGTWGHNVVEPVANAVMEWEKRYRFVDYVTKGSNYKTEHYSAVQAEVPDPEDPSTLINTPFIETLEEADIIGISGQALSHCVANTVTDIADQFGDDNIKKLVLLEDTTSPVPTFEGLGEDFLKDMKARGMQVARSTDFLA